MISLTRQQINRLLVGVLAVALLVAGAAIGIVHSIDDYWCGSFVRAGLLLGAFWVGMPTRGRAAAWANVNPWMTVAVLAGVILLIRRPQVLFPLAGALWFLTFALPMMLRSLGLTRDPRS